MKNILIAGAGRGIGLQIATMLHKKQKLYAISRNPTPELTGLNAEFFQADVTDSQASYSIPEVLHGLVYCPGSIRLKPFNRLTPVEFEEDFRQNVLGAVNLIQRSLPALKKAEGASVVLFSTVAVKTGMPFHASIAAAKGAVEGLARSLAAELAPSKIRVNVIAPSLTDTNLAAGLLNTPEKKDAASKRHPLGRVGTPGDMASLATFLLSDDASWITGQVIGVDGGLGRLKVG